MLITRTRNFRGRVAGIRGRAFAAIVLMAALLSVVPQASADWLMPGANAARTGFSGGEGPTSTDVALTDRIEVDFRLPSVPADPIIVNGTLYVLMPDATKAYVYAIDLATGRIERFIQASFGATHLLSDGHHLVLVGHGRLEVYVVGDARATFGVELNQYANSAGGLAPFAPECGRPAISDHVVFVACIQQVGQFTRQTYLKAFDLSAKAAAWPTIVRDLTPDDPPRDEATQGTIWAQNQLYHPTGPFAEVVGVSVVGSVVVAVTHDVVRQPSVDAATARSVMWGVDKKQGTSLWAYDISPFPTPYGASAPGAHINRPPLVTGDDKALFFETQQLQRHDPATGAYLDGVGFRANPFEGDLGSGLAFDGSSIYATAHTELHRFNSNLGGVWSTPLPSGEFWEEGSLALVDGRIYARSVNAQGTHTVYVIDPDNGAIIQRLPFITKIAMVVDSGIMALLDPLGNLRILGTNSLSINPQLATRTQFPGVGDAVEIDFTGSKAGARGPPVEFRADWGDGAVTEWQTSPVLSHRYGSPLDARARFELRNAEGQTATAHYTFYVGRQVEQTWLQAQFSEDLQERTFFLIGIGLTAFGGSVGLLRLRYRRGRLQKELKAIEDVFKRTQANPAHAERALAERRAHVGGLLVDGKIDEMQSQFLERRIDQLSSSLRMSALEGKFDFLPFGMVRSLQAMLEDGHLNKWEHDHFLLALNQEKSLTPAQRHRVKELIDGWFATDSGAMSA